MISGDGENRPRRVVLGHRFVGSFIIFLILNNV